MIKIFLSHFVLDGVFSQPGVLRIVPPLNEEGETVQPL